MFTMKKSWLIILPFIISLVIIITALILSRFLPSRLPLFYSLPWGDKELAQKLQILIIPGIIILVTLSNLIISWQLHSSQIFFKKILLFSSVLVSLVLSITFLKIVSIFI